MAAAPAFKNGFIFPNTPAEIVEEFIAGDIFVDHGNHQQNHAAQHRSRDQRGFQPADRSLQHIGHKQAGQQYRNQIEKSPGTKVPKIDHSDHLISHFYISGKSVRISEH